MTKDADKKAAKKAAHDMTQAEKKAERDRRKAERDAGKVVEDAPDDDSDLDENTTGSVPTAIVADPSGGADATVAGEGGDVEINDTGAVYDNQPPEPTDPDANVTGTVEENNPPESTVPGAVPTGNEPVDPIRTSSGSRSPRGGKR